MPTQLRTWGYQIPVFVAAQFPFVQDALQINPVKDYVLEVDIDDLVA